MILKEVMSDISYTEDKACKFADVTVIKEFYSHITRWIGTHKNVHYWVILENGYAVGWNESPSRGFSFPVIKLKPEIFEILLKC